MSELSNAGRNERDFRQLLFGTVSIVALTVSSVVAAAEDDTGQPLVWIELGGQIERIDNSQTIFAPPFFETARPGVVAPLEGAQKQPLYSLGEEGKITFEPRGSSWSFSASARYGRANLAKHLHYQTAHLTYQTFAGFPVTETGRPVVRFSDGQNKVSDSHLLLDFMAGKDVGLGMFGSRGTSIVSAGVRFAQFTSSSRATMHARPMYRSGANVGTPGHLSIHSVYFKSNTAFIQARRGVTAIGPALSWDASMPFAGNGSSATLAFDWGVNAAILFGRQRARVHHQTTGKTLYDYPGGFYPSKIGGYTNKPADQNRARNVTIPNVGGFAGISFRYLNAKVKFGYRADFFFGAMDGGIDTAKKENVGLYGPFATVSVGIGG
ncbi:MAG TPA: hypothetical protein VIJ62_11305 [Rhizomicrobium sp.]